MINCSQLKNQKIIILIKKNLVIVKCKKIKRKIEKYKNKINFINL